MYFMKYTVLLIVVQSLITHHSMRGLARGCHNDQNDQGNVCCSVHAEALATPSSSPFFCRKSAASASARADSVHRVTKQFSQLDRSICSMHASVRSEGRTSPACTFFEAWDAHRSRVHPTQKNSTRRELWSKALVYGSSLRTPHDQQWVYILPSCCCSCCMLAGLLFFASHNVYRITYY